MATHAGVALELGIVRPQEGKSRFVIGSFDQKKNVKFFFSEFVCHHKWKQF